MLSAISLVTRVRVSAWLGSTERFGRPQQDVVEGQAERDVGAVIGRSFAGAR